MDQTITPGLASGRAPGIDIGWIVPVAIVFVAFWTVYPVLSQFNLDPHGDMVENYAWGIAWQAGYYKHPPLFAWVAGAWFSVFPRADWAYYLLSAANSALGLVAMWLIAARFLDAHQRRLAALAWFFLPGLTFLSITYNANSAMIPLWGLTVLFYLRTLEGRRVADALLLGVFAGLTLLAKYYSAVLVLAIVLHALFDAEVRPLLRTRLVPVAAAAGLAVLAPHVVWLFSHDFLPIRYANTQGSGRFADTLYYAGEFIVAGALYTLPAFLLLAAHRRFRDGQPLFAFDELWRLRVQPLGRALLFTAFLPPILSLAIVLPMNAELSSVWAIPLYHAAPIILVLLLPRELAARHCRSGPAVLAAFLAVLLALSPLIRQEILARARANSAVPIRAIAEAVEKAWRARTGAPLAIVAGETFLANGTSFYAGDSPDAVQAGSLANTAWVTAADIARDGAAALCRPPNLADCLKQATSVLERVDAQETVTVAAPVGGGGPPSWPVRVLMRFPDKP